MRRHIALSCGPDQLAATLDPAPGTTGLLIVSGGSETRAGAFNGQAQLAARIAHEGHPVFRFDRRGIGDSEGENRGYRSSSDDIAAAIQAFRKAAPQLERIVAFGNCDAASALMLTQGAGCDVLVLANPWTFEDETDSAHAPAMVRARYAQKLRDPRALFRLFTGNVSISKLLSGLLHSLKKDPGPPSLVQDLADGLAPFTDPVRILVAGRDRTGLAFVDRWSKGDERIATCDDATHGFVEGHARDWLFRQLMAALNA